MEISLPRSQYLEQVEVLVPTHAQIEPHAGHHGAHGSGARKLYNIALHVSLLELTIS